MSDLSGNQDGSVIQAKIRGEKCAVTIDTLRCEVIGWGYKNAI